MSNPNQEIIESRLATYIDGELEDNERLEIEQHLQQNPQYRKVIDDLRKQRDMLRGLPREAAPLDIAEAFTNQLERAELLDTNAGRIDRRPMRINALPRLMAAAAIVLLTVGLGVIVYMVLPDRNVQKFSVAPIGPKTVSPATTAPGDELTDEQPDRALPDDHLAVARADAGKSMEKAREPLPLANTHAPEALNRPATADDRKNADREGLESAALSPNQARSRQALPQQPRDAELDRLAENVSKDPQVKALLASDFDEKRNSAPGASLPATARVVVVRANDPKQVEAELTKLFGRDNVDWHPAPKPLELALNTSLSQQSEEALQSNGAANKREISARAIESEKLAEIKDKDAAAKSPAAKPGGTFFATQQGQQGLGKGQTSPNNASEKLAANNASSPTTDSPVLKDNAPHDRAENVKAAKETTTLSRVAAFDDQEKSPAAPEKGQVFAANAAPVQNMYVARRLSPRQVAELNACLAQNAEVKKTDEYRRLGEYKIDDYGVATSVPTPLQGEAALNPPAPAAAAPPAPLTVPGSIGRQHAVREELRGTAAGGAKAVDHAPGGTTQGADAVAVPSPAAAASPSSAATRPDSIVHPGDQLKLQFANADKSAEQSQTVKVQDDGTISPQGKPVQVAGKTLDEVKKTLTQSQQASNGGGGATTPLAVSVERVPPASGYLKDRTAGGEPSEPAFGSAEKQARLADQPAELGQRRASADGLANGPTTQPTLDAAAAEGTVDVVIVIQQQPGVLDTIAAPMPAPAEKPAASIAPPVISPATTRPATPGK